MARKRVDSTHPETESEAALADDIADYGPGVIDVIGPNTPSPNPYDPSKSIDRNMASMLRRV